MAKDFLTTVQTQGKRKKERTNNMTNY